MPTTSTSRLADEVADAVALGDAARVAHQLGGIVANDERVRDAIHNAMENSPNPADVLAAIAKVLKE
jgi:hypothetical protein